MKKILFLASAFAIGTVAMAQSESDKQTTPVTQAPVQTGPVADDVAKFDVEAYDFQKIKQGTPVNYAFTIKNISNKPLVVENSWASCGCTTPEKITEPIMPGATAKLKVQYNAAALGAFTKDVFVQFAGVNGPKKVQITGEVATPEAYETWVKEQKNKPATTTKTKTPAAPANH